MSHWNAQNSYNRPGTRQFQKINYKIECLKEELYRNEDVLAQELDSNIFSDLERAFLAAEVFKNRLIALNESCLSHIALVQCAASAKNHSENNWNANFREDNRYKYSNQYSAHHSWPRYSRYQGPNNWNNNNRNQRIRNNGIQQHKKQIVPVSPNTVKVKTETTSVIKSIANNKSSTAPVRAAADVTIKTNSSPAVNCTAAVKKAVKRPYSGKEIMTPAKKNCHGPAIMMPVKTEMITPRKTPSYPKGYRLQFSAADRITIKSEAPATPSPFNRKIKVESRGNNSMQDDLDSHI